MLTCLLGRNLFTRQEVLDPGPILDHVAEKVTTEINEALMQPYTAEEVRRAVFSMGPNKAPGPDGLTAGFYQFHSEVLGSGVTNAVLEFLNGGTLPDSVNNTTIVLIPKVKHPQEMKQFRPISLCNVIYKVCSKVLANRLRPFLDDVVAEEQSAFVSGRLITDNVLVAYECTHYLQRKKGKTGACAIKIDMAKAYDRVEWEYLRRIMLKLGFNDTFVSLIMRCVTSVSFSIKVNGVLSSVFCPSRDTAGGSDLAIPVLIMCRRAVRTIEVNWSSAFSQRGSRGHPRSMGIAPSLYG